MQLGDLPRSDPLNDNDPSLGMSWVIICTTDHKGHRSMSCRMPRSIAIREMTRQAYTYLLVNVFCY